MPMIKGIVTNQVDKTSVPGVEVELFVLLKGKAVTTLTAISDKTGRFEIALTAKILPKIATVKTYSVVGEVRRGGTELISVTNNPLITNLRLQDYEMEVLVNLPTAPRGRISGVVRSVADNTPLPGAAVELLVQSGTGHTLETTADGGGRFEVRFDENTIPPLWQFQQGQFPQLPSNGIFVLARVRRNATESIPVTNNPLITNLEVRDYNVDVLVALPVVATGRITGFVRSATDHTGVPGIGVRIRFSRRTAIEAPLVQLLTTQTWTTPDGHYQLFLDVARLPFLREPNIVVTAEVWRDDIEHIPSTPVEPLPLSGLRDYRLDLEVQLPLATGPFSVSGRVTDSGGVAAAGLTVIAVDRDMRREEPLGSTTTDGDGRYKILYAATQFTRAEKEHADLVVRVMGDGRKTELATSPVRFNAQQHETIDIQLEDAMFRGASEYERHVAIMRPVIEDVVLSGLTDADLEFVTGETSIPLAQLEAIRLDAQWREQHSGSSLPDGTFYGLLRQGLPKTLPSLLRQGTQRWREALTQSLASNSVPQALRPQLDQILQALTALAVDHAFVPAPEQDEDVQPLGVLLAKTGLSPEHMRLIAKTSLTLSQDADEATWTKTLQDAGVSQPAVNSARFAIQAYTLFEKHLPTLVQLQQTVAKDYASVADLAQLSRAQWLTFAKGLETKKQLPTGFADAAAYSQALANNVEALFPTKVLAHHLTATTDSIRQAVGHFLLANPSFNLLQSPVDSFVATAKLDGITVPREALQAQLGKEARLARLMPVGDRARQIEQLLNKGFDSAAKISTMGRIQFINMMSPSIGVVAAKEIQKNAKARSSDVALWIKKVGEFVSPVSRMLPGTTPAPTGELATWAAMFGHGNGCSCSPCESAHGPAAYLVDLFEFLKDKDADGPEGSKKTLLDILFARRPDLQHLHLNCANAETPLPYIDLVIEHLEQLAGAPEASLTYDENTTPQTPETLSGVEDIAASLRAVPHTEPKEVPQALYPWNLPFDRRHLEAGVYFNALGVTPADVLELKATTGDELHRARLGLSPRLWEILHLTQQTRADEVANAWGLEQLVAPDGPRLDKLAGEDGVLLARSGVSIEDLVALIASPLFSGWSIAINRSPGESDDPCNIEHAQLQKRVGGSAWSDLGINQQLEVFDLMHRVLRLRVALNWPLSRLTQALQALGVGKEHPKIDLVALSRLVWLSSTFEVSVEHLSALLIALEQQPADDMARTHAEQAWLAMLKVSPEDHAHLRALGLEDTLAAKFEVQPGSDTTTPEEPPSPGPVRLERLEGVQAVLEVLRAADLDPAELRYLLRDEDLVPSVFTPREKDLNAHLASIVAAIQNVPVDPPSIAKLKPEATAEDRMRHQTAMKARDSMVAELDQLRVRAVEERLSEITGATWMNHVIADVPRRVPLVASDTDQTRGAIHDFISFAAVSIPPDPVREPMPYRRYKELRVAATQSFRRVLKAARLLVMLKATSEDVEALTKLTRDDTTWLDFKSLPLSPPVAGKRELSLSAIRELVYAMVVQSGMPKADRRMLDIIASSTTEAQALSELENITAWGRSLSGKPGNGEDALKELVATIGLDRANWWRLPSSLAPLQRAVRWLQQHRIKVAPDRNELDVLLKTTIPIKPAESRPITALRDLARSRFARERDYYSAITPAMDRLRMAHRDALLAHILHSDPRWRTADDVYGYLLIDVQMGPCQLTSRIVQAHSTVQLFVQRCLMNLETASGVLLGNVSDIAEWRQWDWMKNYRVWEAARKVFLYPENWIEPDLRIGKSPFFEDLENELLQDEITPDHAERAVRGYITKLHEVARLDIRALYEEEYTEPLGNGDTATRRVIHMVGRTHAVPHSYYYRKRLNDLTWTPWEKIELSIDSDHLALVVHNKRPMLFWPQFKEVQPDRDDPSSTFREVRLSWSVLDQDRWQAPRSTPEFVTTSVHEIFKRMTVLQTAQDGTELSVVLYEFRFIHDDGFSRNVPIGEFRLQLCSGRLQALPLQGGAGRSLVKPLDTILEENKIIGIFNTSSPLFYMDVPTFAILGAAAPKYVLTPTHQYSKIGVPQPFVYADDERQFIATSRKVPWFLVNFLTGQFTWIGETAGYQFETLYHPYSCLMLKAIEEEGLAGLYRSPNRFDQETVYSGTPPERFPRQLMHEGARTFVEKYKPTMLVWRDEKRAPFVYPLEEFDFSENGAYSLYNWEVFFHVPLLLADRLSKAGKYQDAQQWFHDIFDPTDVSFHDSPQKYWRVKPLFAEAERWRESAESLETMLRRLSLESEDEKSQVEAWRNDPLNPHLLARIRLVSYMKTVVQKYVENLIAWADSLFRRDTIETINEATQLYVLGSEILGPAPTILPPLTRTSHSYASLQSETTVDEFSNGLGRFEQAMPITSGHVSATTPSAPGLSMFYFCIPSNPRLTELRATINDRLFKIRHCMNIDGRTRQLALFAPPIDPALLVRARAAGLDIGTVLDMALGSRQSPYRFQALLQKALEFSNEVRSFGGALLSALEKRDGEQLGLLRARHEVSLLKLVSEVKQQQIEEAEKQLMAAERSLAQAEKRLEYYSGRQFMNANEESQIVNLSVAHGLETVGQSLTLASSVAFGLPDTFIGSGGGVEYGGTHIGNALRTAGGVLSIVASQATFAANLSSIMAGHERRQDEWKFQAELAQKETEQIDQQIIAAEIRRDIAKNELRNHEQQIAQAEQTESFLRDKFTNAQLYNWMSAQLSALHYQAYRMAFDLARQAEAAAHREVGTPDEPVSGMIKFDHWDSGRKGLLAGERLAQDLRRLEVAYMERNTRQPEITSNLSLRRLNPKALWNLRLNGSCIFTLPTWLFDMDFPGHQRRRIKSVSVSVPGVVGPYGGVNGILECRQGGDVRTIATSSGENDAGVFQLDFRDERYLPFEGIGLDPDPSDGTRNTSWSFSLPAENRPFDYETISDVVLHIQYTAKVGAEEDVRAARESLNQLRTSDSPLKLLVSVRHDFPAESRQLREQGATSVTVALDDRLFPYFARNCTIQEIVRLAGLEEVPVWPKNPPVPVVGKPDLVLEATDADSYFIVTYTLTSSHP